MTRPALGGWITRDPSTALELYACTAVDFAAIDCQHSVLDEADAAAALRLCGRERPRTLVRVSRNDAAAIGRVADAGADGVIVPMVDDAVAAQAAVAACRFPPLGVRSFGPFGQDPALGTAELESAVAVYAMIETAAALEQVGEICATQGISGVYAGPADLSIALGLDPQAASDQLAEPLRRVVEACRAAGVVAGVHAGGGQQAQRFAELGYELITLGSYESFFADGVERSLAEAR
jgi:4-hydroxy-2-oxoheptanedioate aldolase